MPYVLTVDQIASRIQPDVVEEAIASLGAIDTVLDFSRTVGDEFQGVLTDPLSVVTAILELMRMANWHIGLGIGPVETPLPPDTREARGTAFVAARSAVELAKNEPTHVRVIAGPPAEQLGRDAEVVLHLLATLREKRSEAGWDAVDLMNTGVTMAEAAETLDVSRQAVGQRLQAAHWSIEKDSIPVIGRLLDRAEGVSTGRISP
jgi:hypothetical protein